LAKLVKALDERFGQGPEGLKVRWREIAGEQLAARTEPSKLIKPRNGGGAVLELKVDGPAAALIQHQAAEILARVNLFLGEGAAAKLRIVQGPVRRTQAGEAAAKAARSRRARAQPLDAGVERELENSLERLADGPLKQALRRLEGAKAHGSTADHRRGRPCGPGGARARRRDGRAKPSRRPADDGRAGRHDLGLAQGQGDGDRVRVRQLPPLRQVQQ
jgi:hypothetical protein